MARRYKTMKRETIINLREIEELFREYCKECRIKFSNKKFVAFLGFLEIDFYDWVRENLRQFDYQ
jgi:hypothetical protein